MFRARWRRAPLLSLLVAMAALRGAPGCSSWEGSSAAPTTTGGSTDRPETSAISVDEAGITGRIESGALKVELPVTGRSSAEGTLRVRLISVAGTKEFASSDVPYSLADGEKRSLLVELAAPTVSEQAELVDYVLAIGEEGSTLRVHKSLLHVIPPFELEVRGPATVRVERPASYRLTARNAVTGQPLPGYDVSLNLDQDGEVTTLDATTSDKGDAVVEYSSMKEGQVALAGSIKGSGTEARVASEVAVEATGQKLLLTSDKPLYQPGQTMHLRALGLERGNNRPLTGNQVTFEVKDGKGNKVFKKTIETSDFGVASSDFKLGSLVNEGTYTLSVIAGDATTEKSVTVTHYALPKFDLAIKTEKPFYRPSEDVVGTVDAKYFFGKLVAGGDVVVEGVTLDVGETVFGRVMGKLDEKGHYEFSLTLPSTLVGQGVQNGSAAVGMRVTVTDTAGQVVSKTSSFPVSSTGVSLALVPEATSVVPGIENQLLLFATDPLGVPIAQADVTVRTPDGEDVEFQTDAFGQAELTWMAPAVVSASTFHVAVDTQSGDHATQTFNFTTQIGSEHLLVRTDKAVYAVGEEVTVDILGSSPSSMVYVDWLNDGQTVDMRTLEIADGSATFKMPIDTSLAGDNRVEAYIVDEDGNVVRAGRTVFARTDSALRVDVTPDRETYAPGDPMTLTFSVKDESGAPAVAALGVQVVDQAVYALVDAQPGLLRTYFELDDAFAKPTYEIHAPEADLSRLLFVDTNAEDPAAQKAAQNQSRATFAALKGGALMGLVTSTYPGVLGNAKERLAEPLAALSTTLARDLTARVSSEMERLKSAGCQPYLYCSALGNSWDTLLRGRVEEGFDAADFWGQKVVLTSLSPGNRTATVTSKGPDELDGHGDDQTLSLSLTNLVPPPVPPVDSSPDTGSGGSFGTGGSAALPTPGAGGSAGSGVVVGTGGTGGSGAAGGDPEITDSEPRVRKDFPETLYVNPSVITDDQGQATLEIPLADSITEWRVSTLANSADGKLGGGEKGVTVFQNFFVDVAFPAALTRGDEVSFPIAVYNYLDTEQTVSLELEPASFYTPLGATATELTLAPGQVLGASFPVRVEEVGMNTLTVKAIGSERSDAVARVARVVADGKIFAEAHGGALQAGSITETVSFPTGAVPGSEELYVDVYPAFMAQVVSGMDSMLQVPTGCFEQTTSTAWPNVLVTDYMRKTGQITPEIELKADSLMSAGYQRLLTFEHPGGGFSWFGEQDGAPYLSVTAFGLLEFSDMVKVHPVDEVMIARTAAWLASQQSSDGSWAGDRSEFFSFQTSALRNTAFVAWALSSAGYTGSEVARGLDYVKENLGQEQDAYTLGIIANAFANARGDDPVLADVFAALDALKQVDGDKVHWDSAGTQTSFYGSGDDAAVTSTALVVQALISAGSASEDVAGALAYLSAAKDPNGNFGSTQATIWTLRALTLAAARGGDGAIGSVDVLVDGTRFTTLELTEDQSDVTTRIDLSSLASPGMHEVSLAFDGTGRVSYNLVARHNVPWADLPAEPTGPLTIDVSYDKQSLYVDDTVGVTVSLKNETSSMQNMVLATLGIPPGFEVVTDELVASMSAGTLSSFESTGRQLILYVPEIAPAASLTFHYDLRATMPVQAVDGGAEASLYYEPSTKVTSPAKSLRVDAR